MLSTYPRRARGGGARHAADEPDPVVSGRSSRSGRAFRSHQVLVVHLGGCDFVGARGFRALVVLQEQVLLKAGRMLVLDPPRTLRIICRFAPGRLTLVPGDETLPHPGPQA